MEIKKAVITSAGKATRMRYISNSIPKALLPLFLREGEIRRMRPAIDFIVDSLKSAEATNLCIIMGSKAKPLADYFFDKNVTLVFQNEPKGFGDAVLQAENFVGNEPFFVNADDCIINGSYKEASELFTKMNADCVLFLQRTKTPSIYGIVSVDNEQNFMNHKIFRITGAEEKPQNPKSDLAICATYIFSPTIFQKLKEIKLENGQELQLTSGIEKLINEGRKVYGILLDDKHWLNVGDPDNYYDALTYSYNNF
jgi:dTDP-glucose pyrophosphorylase